MSRGCGKIPNPSKSSPDGLWKRQSFGVIFSEFWYFFFSPKIGKNTKKLKKSDKNAKNVLTSHYANGHGNPCDKWVKKHFDASTGHQVNFLKGLEFFYTPQTC